MFKALSRMFLASMFITSGMDAFLHPDGRAKTVEKAGVPEPRQATILNGAIMAVAGTTLAIGIAPKLSAFVLAATMIPTTLLGHPFWKEDAPQARGNQQIHFNKNVVMIGGLLSVLFQND